MIQWTKLEKKKFLLSNFSVIKPSLAPLSFQTKFILLHSSTHSVRVLDLPAFLFRISTFLDLESQPSQLSQKNPIYFPSSLISNGVLSLLPHWTFSKHWQSQFYVFSSKILKLYQTTPRITPDNTPGRMTSSLLCISVIYFCRNKFFLFKWEIKKVSLNSK